MAVYPEKEIGVGNHLFFPLKLISCCIYRHKLIPLSISKALPLPAEAFALDKLVLVVKGTQMSADWITISSHKGKSVVVLGFSGLKYLEILERIGEFRKFISSQQEKSLLVLTDVTGCEINKRTVEAFKDFALKNKPYVIASAVVGLTGFPRIFVSAVNQFSKRDIRLFDKIDPAKDWLVSHKK